MGSSPAEVLAHGAVVAGPALLVLLYTSFSRLAVLSLAVGLALGSRAWAWAQEDRPVAGADVRAPHLTCFEDAKEVQVQTLCEMDWFNHFIGSIWPRVQEWVIILFHDSVCPSIAKALGFVDRSFQCYQCEEFYYPYFAQKLAQSLAQATPHPFNDSVHFSKVVLGSAQPTFGPLTIFRRRRHGSKMGNVEIKIGISWQSNCDIALSVGPIKIQVSQLSLKGTVSVILVTEPACLKPPFFRGIQVFFANPPELGLKFGGAAAVADFPGVRDVIKQAISGSINKMLVLPNCIGVDMDNDLDCADLRCVQPVGVLKLTLHSASQLSGVMFQAHTDPFVDITVGCQSWKSPVQKGTSDPVWDRRNTAYFLVYDWRQLAQFKVYDQNLLGSSELIGFSEDIHLESLEEAKGLDVKLSQEYSGLPFSRPSLSPGGRNLSHTLGRVFQRATSCPSPQGSATSLTGGSSAPKTIVPAGTLSVSGEVVRFQKPPVDIDSQDTVAFGARAHSCGAFLSVKVMKVEGLEDKWASTLKPPFTVRIASGPEEVEVSTRPSHPAVPARPPEEIVRACMELSRRCFGLPEIARFAGLSEEEVVSLLADAPAADKELAKRAAQRATQDTASRTRTSPHFEQVFHLLLRRPEGDITMELLDRTGKVVGRATKQISTLLEAKGGRLPGPFTLLADQYLFQGAVSVGTLHATLSLQLLEEDSDEELAEKSDFNSLLQDTMSYFGFLGAKTSCGHPSSTRRPSFFS